MHVLLLYCFILVCNNVNLTSYVCKFVENAVSALKNTRASGGFASWTQQGLYPWTPPGPLSGPLDPTPQVSFALRTSGFFFFFFFTLRKRFLINGAPSHSRRWWTWRHRQFWIPVQFNGKPNFNLKLHQYGHKQCKIIWEFQIRWGGISHLKPLRRYLRYFRGTHWRFSLSRRLLAFYTWVNRVTDCLYAA